NPLVYIIIYIFIFSIIMRIRIDPLETGTDSFLIFFLSGFFPWLLFSEGISRATGILIENSNLITKVVFPVELLPIGSVLSAFIINSVGMLIMLIYLMFKGYFNYTWLYLIVLYPLYILFIGGFAYFFSALCVFIRDIKEILGILLMVWFYATPIIYTVSMIPDSLKLLIILNPVNIFISLFRDALLIHQVHYTPILYIAFLSAFSYAFGVWFFMRAKSAFGDVL
ncbi:ABC transporter permease, partial [Desulfobacterales bacterium HSG17]|nr:ABC transporter permease [Desulfobacterales bacterium HSG17]